LLLGQASLFSITNKRMFLHDATQCNAFRCSVTRGISLFFKIPRVAS
jgi:hypothetical protein